MRISAEKQKPAEKIRPSSSAKPGRHELGHGRKANSIIRLQRTVGNQAVQRLLQAQAEELEARLTPTASTLLAGDNGRMPTTPKSDPADIHQVAQEGTVGASRSLPHLDRIQQSFGPGHDLSRVKAHIGGRAADAARSMGAEAYTSGDRVAFAGMPSLKTAAHEATHVVQQRAGVQLEDGLGRTGDKYEQHATEVADEVVAGRSAEGMLAKFTDGGNKAGGVQKQAVQFWGPEHKDFTARAVDRWNSSHPRGNRMHIANHLKSWMMDASDDADHTGRALTGTVSDLRIYYDFVVGGKKRRHREYAAASPEKKKKLEEAARKAVCASEGPTHGEGNRPNYGSGGSAVNEAYMKSQIVWADRLTFGGGFMSRAGAGQLGDAMHCAQDRGSHCEGNRHEGHDDIKDKLGIGGYNTDDPAKNKEGKRKADKLSDQVLAEFAKLRNK